jgi:tRNA A-37 threonylcarbamoyl transferase component Bud32
MQKPMTRWRSAATGTRKSRVSAAPTANTLRAGRYALIGVLGAGSQAETLDAVDKRDGRAVAIKRFQVRGAKSWKDVELAEREARVLATLSHPNLPVYIDHFEEDGALCLVMEKIEGETLASLRRRQAPLSSLDIARFLSDARSALGYLHARVPPIIHRDIKPGNVIRRADGSFVFVDFGSVRDQLKPEGGSTVVGTFGYMAPEQFQGRALPGSDVYAVGATALSLVTGREPEDLPHRGLGIDVPAALGRVAEPWLVRTLSALLEPDPDKRPTRVPALGPLPSSTANSAPDGDWRAIREQGREQGRRLREESRHVGRELKERIREQTRSARRAARRRRSTSGGTWHVQFHAFGLILPVLMTALLAALSVARLLIWALFRMFLPSLLFALSLFFGRPLRRAAWRCQEVGAEVDRGLMQAMAAVRAQLLGRGLEFDGSEINSQPDSEPMRRVRLEMETQPKPNQAGAEHAGAEHAEFETPSPESAPGERREER